MQHTMQYTMQRNLSALADNEFDLLVVGGGIYGAWVAWDAALRGLRVALVDKGDFGHATSANSLKTVHGGLRYLQDGDLGLVRLMIHERMTLLRVAPHLVHPLPCVMPTSAKLMRSRWVMAAALTLNNLLCLDHNRLPDPQKRLPAGRVLSRPACLALLPGVADVGITGGAYWYDAQMYNSERLVLAVVRAAAAQGAVVANYVEATDFLGNAEQVTGIQAGDRRSGDSFAIRARLVINTTGPWINRLLGFLRKPRQGYHVPLSPAMNLVIRRRLLDCAAGVPSWPSGSGSGRQPSRLLFMAPWRETTIIGTTHSHYHGAPGDFRVTADDVAAFLTEINSAYPGAALTPADVAHVHSGFLPAYPDQTRGVKLVRRSQVLDHQRTDGIAGLLSIVGVKYTSARHAAQAAVDLALAKLGMAPIACQTHRTSLFGGRIEQFDHFLAAAIHAKPPELSDQTMRRLVYNYGDYYRNVLAYCTEADTDAAGVDEAAVMRAEVRHAVREEMALTLSDVLLRRTELGTAGRPDVTCVHHCATVMADELGWSSARTQQEIAEFKAGLPWPAREDHHERPIEAAYA